MSTYLKKQISQLDDLTVEDLSVFVDDCGRLDIRIEGEAASRPFAVLNVLREGGYVRSHTWVETDSDADRSPVTLRVTAVLPEKAAVADCGPKLHPRAALSVV